MALTWPARGRDGKSVAVQVARGTIELPTRG